MDLEIMSLGLWGTVPLWACDPSSPSPCKYSWEGHELWNPGFSLGHLAYFLNVEKEEMQEECVPQERWHSETFLYTGNNIRSAFFQKERQMVFGKSISVTFRSMERWFGSICPFSSKSCILSCDETMYPQRASLGSQWSRTQHLDLRGTQAQL